MAQLAWNATPWHWPDTISALVRNLSRRGTTTASHPALARGERILTVASTIDDDPAAVASTRALYYRYGDQPDGWIRIGWEEIESARWQPDERTLTLIGLPGGDRPPINVRLTEPGLLPAVSRDRIAATVIATRLVTIESGPALITVRRRPGTDALVWTVRRRYRSELTQAETDRQVDRAIKAMRADLGI